MTYLRSIAVVFCTTLAACSGSGGGKGSFDAGALVGNQAGDSSTTTAGTGAGVGAAGTGVAGSDVGSTAGSGAAGTTGESTDAGVDAQSWTPVDGGNGDATTEVELDAGMDAAAPEEDSAVGGEMDAGSDAAVSHDPWPPAPATEALQALPGDYATAICAALADCLNPTYYEFAYDGTGCQSRVRAQLEDGEFVYLQASIDAERVTFDPEQLATCYAEVAALSCDVLTTRSPVHCTAAVQGLVPKGDPCVIDSDCVTGTYCDRSASCPGVCGDLKVETAACDRSDQCQGGLSCEGGKCRAPAITGEPCDQAGEPPCGLGNLCVGADADKNTAGTCVDQDTAFSLDAGDECDPTVGDWCKDGLACVVDKRPAGTETDLYAVCKARVAEDAACNFSFAPEQCPPTQYCPADLNPSYKDTCEDRPGVGQACGLGGVCAAGLRCKADKCRGPGRIGDACGAARDCASDRCKSGKCAAPARCRVDAVGPVCGDDACDAEGEDCESCPEDCGACPAVCGNDSCEDGEDCDNCAADCNACPDVCGDNTCDPSETCATCAADCDACPAPYSTCDADADCGPAKKCVKKTVPGLLLLPPTIYGYCAEDCVTDATCSGAAAQNLCTSGSCALQCDAVLGVLDVNKRCPQLGMQCINNVCTWQQ